jgi:hypothetical protein
MEFYVTQCYKVVPDEAAIDATISEIQYGDDEEGQQERADALDTKNCNMI